jgi:HSP20 family protein
MTNDDPRNWMWSEALQMLARAERLHRQVFSPPVTLRSSGPAWEPPTDVLETDESVLILIALPGVDPEKVEVVIQNGVLIIAGERVLPPQLRIARIHRLELPQGRFERHITLPAGRYGTPQTAALNGCVVIELPKAGRRTP